MNTEALPNSTEPAAKIWASVPADTKRHLLANVWCSKCGHEVIIKNFTGVVKTNDLLLVGQCSVCHGDVARLIEMG